MANTNRKKCLFPKCEDDAIEEGKYCSTRCRINYNALVHRRKKGQLSREESIAALDPRKCAQCDKGFTPTSPKQIYCEETCRDEAAKLKRRTKEKTLDSREYTLYMLDMATGTSLANNVDWELFKWTKKEDFFMTDDRWDWTKKIIAEAKAFLVQEGAMSLRSLFYHLVHVRIDGEHNPSKCEGTDCAGCTLLTNTKSDYTKLTEVMTGARERGDIAPDAFDDNVRESITYSSWADVEAFKKSVAPAYQIDLWEKQKRLVEVWTEKDSLVSVLEDTVGGYRVPLRVLRGQGSTPYLYSIAKDLQGIEKPITIYYFGDHDPAGYIIETSARQRLYSFLMEEFNWTAERVAKQFTWKRIGFLHEDFEKYDIEALPEDDKTFGLEEFMKRFPDGRKAELEGLTPRELRRRTSAAIEEVMGRGGLKHRKADLEREEREKHSLIETW
jgi:hypothetical protein